MIASGSEEIAMVKLVVLYGHPTDPTAFEQYYQRTHMPLAQQIPNMRRVEVGRVLGTPTGERADYYRQAEFWFESVEQLQASMGSEQGRAAANDLANFATGGVTLFIAEA
jgi:uncharacterized protein (TIGR02118 family)